MCSALSGQLLSHCSCNGHGAGSSQQADFNPVVGSEHRMAVLMQGHSGLVSRSENSLTTLLNSFHLPLPANTGMPGLKASCDNFNAHVGLAPAQGSARDQGGNLVGLPRIETAAAETSAVIKVSGNSDTPFNLPTAHSVEKREVLGRVNMLKKPPARTRKQPRQKRGQGNHLEVLNGLHEISQVSHPLGLEGVVAAPICLLCGKHLSGCRMSFCRRCDSKVYGESQDVWRAEM
mmetsp:Transcript_126436/g.252637  ORF Transcript_126436/g.252637 Transcript_126436/m.252637 type:complete len:233 (+) Transcript_126436:25-723(+)